ncbi:Transcriptional Coactivator p15 (PC4) [Faunimonas pinastri]|uniref:Transcriptional Coactivator p15 (PC4) n=1 Tax=Faunimonas pinastri TaxID=1855383 RepID=A0A1H9QDJ4_9HYPH|nr:transcriptional coactivator p15/PC4 family protein [Faunimonas pinastri]SER58482.1 Transcriptional Coactivator p15 (PC4) [Faunimonas pinastri]
MSDDLLIAEIRKNARETIRVVLNEFKGQRLVGLRVWYRDADGQMKPGREGFACRIEQLPELADAVSRGLETAREKGLVS